jgi:pyrroline-5-carboxylate reductase
MTNRRLALLGAGNMGRALLAGLLRSGTRAEHVTVGEQFAAARESLGRELGVAASADNAQAVAGADVVILAVKPQDAESVLRPLAAGFAAHPPLVISVAAGIRAAQLQAWCGAGVAVVRAMPNRPALVGAGVSGLYAPAGVGGAARATASQVLGSVGEVVWVEAEELLDVVTALSGSGPAYFFLLAELMARSGAELGLPQAAAQRLAAATLYGAGLMARGAESQLAPLREAVTSPGGTTAAALAVFGAEGLEGTVARALAAAVRRSRELAAPHPK